MRGMITREALLCDICGKEAFFYDWFVNWNAEYLYHRSEGKKECGGVATGEFVSLPPVLFSQMVGWGGK